MKRLTFTLIAAAFASLTGSTALASQSTVDRISQFVLHYTVKDNQAGEHGVDCAALGAEWAACAKAVITLTNNADALTDRDWVIYFHSIREILQVENQQFKITHITGDLHKLEPGEAFSGFPAHATVEIPIVLEYWQLFITDVMPRWYVTAQNATPKIIANTDTEDLEQFATVPEDQWKRVPDDRNVYMTATTRFDKNDTVKALPASALRGQIIPTPYDVVIHDKNVDLAKGVKPDLTGLDKPAQQAILQRFARLGVKTNGAYPVRTRIAPTAFQDGAAVSGAYSLEINDKEAVITGYDPAGVFYGLQSVLSLVPTQGPLEIAQLEAKDHPRFAYRGVELDVGRNFVSKQAVLRLLDQMAAYKLNKFHFHLTDDEGWRLEIPGLPELTEIGSKRCHTVDERDCLLPQLGSGPFSNNNGSGYFSRADYIEIVKYASARQIEVIPEIDMPAHARAAVMSMEERYRRLMQAGREEEANAYRLLDPQDTSRTTSVQFYDRHSYLNPCLPSSVNFADKVIGEIQKMHQEAGQPLSVWHFGGDEAKNIRLGAGYTDLTDPVAGKGRINQKIEDKPWAKSPACQAVIAAGKITDYDHLSSYFGKTISELVKKHGIDTMQAWQDGLKAAGDAKEFATGQVNVNFWDTLYGGGYESVNDWANKGFRVVISNPDYVYLDFPYEVNVAEKGYYWGTRFSDTRKIFSFAPDNLPQNAETSVDRDGHFFTAKGETAWPGAYGISAQIWGEAIRTDERREYMAYPRLLAVAERAWHRAAWEQDYAPGREYQGGVSHLVDTAALERDWQLFANLIGQREMEKLEKAGLHYRLPVPGARIRDGKLEVNTAFPGVPVEYTQDEGKNWLRYDDNDKPAAGGKIIVRATSENGKHVSRPESVGD